MSRIEIKRFAAGASYGIDGPFPPGYVVGGKTGGRPTLLTILENGEFSLNGVVLSSDGPLVLFDPEGRVIKTNRLLIGLSDANIDYLLSLQLKSRIPLFGDRDKTKLAGVLGDLFNEGVREMGIAISLESLPSKIGNGLSQLLCFPKSLLGHLTDKIRTYSMAKENFPEVTILRTLLLPNYAPSLNSDEDCCKTNL